MYLKLTKNKGIEINLYLLQGEWFIFKLATRSKQDHPGFIFTFSLLKLFEFEIHFYDGRHWNYKENRFYNDGEELEEYNMTKHSEKIPKYLNIKIIADTEEDKIELINTSKYLHDFCVIDKQGKYICLDHDYIAINFLMHLYTSPEIIEIKNK